MPPGYARVCMGVSVRDDLVYPYAPASVHPRTQGSRGKHKRKGDTRPIMLKGFLTTRLGNKSEGNFAIGK